MATGQQRRRGAQAPSGQSCLPGTGGAGGGVLTPSRGRRRLQSRGRGCGESCPPASRFSVFPSWGAGPPPPSHCTAWELQVQRWVAALERADLPPRWPAPAAIPWAALPQIPRGPPPFPPFSPQLGAARRPAGTVGGAHRPARPPASRCPEPGSAAAAHGTRPPRLPRAPVPVRAAPPGAPLAPGGPPALPGPRPRVPGPGRPGRVRKVRRVPRGSPAAPRRTDDAPRAVPAGPDARSPPLTAGAAAPRAPSLRADPAPHPGRFGTAREVGTLPPTGLGRAIAPAPPVRPPFPGPPRGRTRTPACGLPPRAAGGGRRGGRGPQRRAARATRPSQPRGPRRPHAARPPGPRTRTPADLPLARRLPLSRPPLVLGLRPRRPRAPPAGGFETHAVLAPPRGETEARRGQGRPLGAGGARPGPQQGEAPTGSPPASSPGCRPFRPLPPGPHALPFDEGRAGVLLALRSPLDPRPHSLTRRPQGCPGLSGPLGGAGLGQCLGAIASPLSVCDPGSAQGSLLLKSVCSSPVSEA